MNIRIIAFSNKGIELIKRIKKATETDRIIIAGYYKMQNPNPEYSKDEEITPCMDIDSWTEEGFLKKEAIIFIGATGIAVRHIAPFVKDKLNDSSVITIDDNGTFVIPLLSGHVGGANKLAVYLSEKLNMIPVVTTSTDVNDAFSVDTFATENNLAIVNRDKIKKVSAKAIEGKPITLCIQDYPNEDTDVYIDINNKLDTTNYDGLVLKKKSYVIGIGLKKDKITKDVETLLLNVLEDNGIEINDVYALASIDIKKDENALHELSLKYRIPLLFFSGDMLNRLKGDFSSSEFVKSTVGVDNVCERAAVLGAGPKARLIVNKKAQNGVTIAIAARNTAF